MGGVSSVEATSQLNTQLGMQIKRAEIALEAGEAEYSEMQSRLYEAYKEDRPNKTALRDQCLARKHELDAQRVTLAGIQDNKSLVSVACATRDRAEALGKCTVLMDQFQRTIDPVKLTETVLRYRAAEQSVKASSRALDKALSRSTRDARNREEEALMEVFGEEDARAFMAAAKTKADAATARLPPVVAAATAAPPRHA
jgi:hypothetical protein